MSIFNIHFVLGFFSCFVLLSIAVAAIGSLFVAIGMRRAGKH